MRCGPIDCSPPAESVGLEVNLHLAAALCKFGLNSQCYDGSDHFSFVDFSYGHYKILVMVHVLEHCDDAGKILKKILNSCFRIGIERTIIVAPGAKDYSSDQTHNTFVNENYLKGHELFNCKGSAAREISYFPINHESIGKYFIFCEFKFTYEKISDMQLS